MIKVATQVIVSDNSSARVARCIKVLKGSYASVGDIIVVAIQRVITRGSIARVQRGEIHRAVVVETKAPWTRHDGIQMRSHRNAIVLINAQGLPLGTRVLGVASYELRARGFMRILSLCAHAI